MLNIKVSGINRVRARIEGLEDKYKRAVDDTLDYAREIILSRIRRGKLISGGTRTASKPYQGSRYSERRYDERRAKGLGTRTHTLRDSGGLYDSFKVSQGRKRGSGNYGRSLYFAGTVKDRTITYAELARWQERNSGQSFNLSPTQMRMVRTRFQTLIRSGRA